MQLATADNSRPVTLEQLPQASQQFIKQHFPEAKVAFAKMEKDLFDTEYEVTLINGDQLEFNRDGDWKKLKCKRDCQ